MRNHEPGWIAALARTTNANHGVVKSESGVSVDELDSKPKMVSSLGVIPPLSGVRPHRNRSSSSKLSVPSPDRLQQQAREQIFSAPELRGPKDQLASEVQLESHDEILSFSETLRAIPSWLISMVVHVAILLILAFWTLSLDEMPDGQIVVEISLTARLS